MLIAFGLAQWKDITACGTTELMCGKFIIIRKKMVNFPINFPSTESNYECASEEFMYRLFITSTEQNYKNRL